MTSDIKKQEILKLTGQKVSAGPPKVSVIIPAYNIAAYISETLDSAVAQTFKDFEIIVINDGSPDTVEFERVLEPYRDHIIYLKQENAGAGAARNVAIEQARGRLLAFLDGDDIWQPEFLESQASFLAANNYDLVYADAELFGNGALAGKTYMQTSPSEGEANFESLLDLRCNVITSGVMARKEAVLAAGLFEWEKVRAHDFHLWLRMVKNGARIGYQKRVLLRYRIHLDSLSGNSVQQVQREIDVYHRIKRMIALNESQREIVERQLTRLEGALEIERGKSFLLQKDFAAARQAFEKANTYHKSIRLGLIIKILRFAPQLLLKFYQFRRRNEIAFVSHNEKPVV